MKQSREYWAEGQRAEGGGMGKRKRIRILESERIVLEDIQWFIGSERFKVGKVTNKRKIIERKNKQTMKMTLK